MSREPIEKMTQKEFFESLKNEIVNCINAESDAINPNFYFNFTEVRLTVEEYKKQLIEVRTKLDTFNFEKSPAYYILTLTDLLKHTSDTNPVLKWEYYQFLKQRVDYYVCVIERIMKDPPLNRFNYFKLIEPEIKFPGLDKHMKEKLSSNVYYRELNALQDPEQSPLPHHFLLLELMVMYVLGIKEGAEINEIIAESFSVSKEKIHETVKQLVETLLAARKLIKDAPNSFDFTKMKSAGIKVLIAGINYFGKKTYGPAKLTEKDVEIGKKIKKLRTLLESNNPSNAKDQITIAGIINYMLENNFIDSEVMNNILFSCMTDDFKKTFENTKEDDRGNLLKSEFNLVIKKFTSEDLQMLEEALLDTEEPRLSQQGFFPSSDDDSEPPPERANTPPPNHQ